MLVDVWMDGKGITGKDAEKALEAALITVNKNTIPFDQNKPFVASGLRIGTPQSPTRGMKEDEMREIGRLIAEVIHAPNRKKSPEGKTRVSQTSPRDFLSYPKTIERVFETRERCRMRKLAVVLIFFAQPRRVCSEDSRS
jgi:glycine hydroxymethyltransferase